MKSSKVFHHAALSGFMLIALAACDGEEAVDLTTTSSLVATPSPTAGSTTTEVEPGGSSTTTDTTLVGQSVEDYEIVARESDTAGETLYIVVPPGAYTDVDVENFVFGLVDDETVTFGAEIFDDAAAVEAYRKEEAERTEAETALIEQHHFASVINGNTIRFQGPFAESGEHAIGS